MNPELGHLGIAAAFWILIHLGLAASPLRAAIVARIGTRGFQGLFSLLSAAGLAWLAWSYRSAMQPDAFYGLRVVDGWMLWVPLIAMPFALLLLVGSLTVPNPTLTQGERALAQPEAARGILRVTRHPMLWAFTLWALAHLIAKGDAASLMFFGSFALVAINGMHSIDRKRAASDPKNWARFAAATSILPFAAIASGRNRLVFPELGWWRIGLAFAAWAVILLVHPYVFGVAAFPG